MRKRFDPQYKFGRLLIEDTPTPKGRDALGALVVALREIFKNKEFRERILDILSEKLIKGKKKTGRPGMDLWALFVLAQIRLSKQLSYDELETQANYNKLVRQVMGVESDSEFEVIEFSYQTIVDNVSMIDDQMLQEINQIIVEFGHGEVFKKKETEALRLKTDSFVVESNVHFPTDYNLLWDCCRKCLNLVEKQVNKYSLSGWRKIKNWYKDLKILMRKFGKISSSGGKNKEKRILDTALKYIEKSRALSNKIEREKRSFPICDPKDLAIQISLDQYLIWLNKHIDLFERRVIKGEVIPQDEKMFSVFEPYTEWIAKGKMRPNVELGKKLNITTDQYQLIVDYHVVDNQSDSALVIKLADRLIGRYPVQSWSFDKGYWNSDNKELLELVVPEVILPKKGRCNEREAEHEHSPAFKKLRNKHSAIESNINSLETRGLSRCPDRGRAHFERYAGLAVCAYNLCCIGRKLIANYREDEKYLKNAS